MAQLSISLLGTFQVTRNDQLITRFRSTNVQGLLVYLALQAERPFPREVLATLFWPDEPDKVALTNLRQSLYQLRKAIGDVDGQGQPYLLISRSTVQFNQAADAESDVGRFLTAVQEHDLETAVTLYQGELLPGFTSNSLPFEEWLLTTRETLHRQALAVLFDFTEQCLQNRQYGQARYWAQQQLVFEPWREEAHRQLMQALALNGERSAALAQFDTCRHIVMDEFGTEPDAATLALHERILSGDEAALLGQTAVSPFNRPIQAPHNLPAQVTPFFDREEYQALLLERVPQPSYRLVTLVGEGGIGKSRLAQEVALQLRDYFSDGVWFVPLAGLETSENEPQTQAAIATTIAHALNIPLQGQKSPQAQLLSFLRERHMLLLLDNFEHVLAGADLVIDLLEQAPHTAVVCTSREPLGFMAEWTLPLDQLSAPSLPDATPYAETAVPAKLDQFPAVQLFVDRAERANGRFALTAENAPQVVQVCHLVAGLPLALELAAASLRQRPLTDLIAAIQTTIDSLSTKYRDIPPRHRSMRAVFMNSWVLLPEAEQRLFASLAVFRGGFTLESAQAVTGENENNLRVLAEKSLLHEGDNGRYNMHDLLRQFAAEKCADLGLVETVSGKHSRYYLTVVANQAAALVGETPQIPATLIAADLDNVRKAWETAVVNQAADLILACAPALSNFYQIRGLYQEGERLFAKAADSLKGHAEAIVIAHLQTFQAGLLVRLSAYQPAIALIDEALPVAAQADQWWLQSRLHITWGEALWRQGSLDAAETQLKQAQLFALEAPSRFLEGAALFNLGIVYDYKGVTDRSLACLEEALVIWQQSGNKRAQGFALNSIGVVAYRAGAYEKAQAALKQALTISQNNDALQGQSMALNNLSLLSTDLCEFDAAKLFLLQALQIAQFSGDRHAEALVFYNLGWNGQKAGWLAEAEDFATTALQLWREIGDRRGEAKALMLMGSLAEDNGRLQEAATYLQTSLSLSQQVGDKHTEAEVKQKIQELSQD